MRQMERSRPKVLKMARYGAVPAYGVVFKVNNLEEWSVKCTWCKLVSDKTCEGLPGRVEEHIAMLLDGEANSVTTMTADLAGKLRSQAACTPELK